MRSYLRNNPQIKRIILCLDMDTPGQETAEQLRKKYAEMGYEISQEKPRIGKDWNEYLQKRKTLECGDELSNINCDPSISIPKNFKEEFST